MTERGGYRHQWPSIRLRLWIPLTCWIHHLIIIISYAANSKYRWRKNIWVRKKSVYTVKLSGFKVVTLDSGLKISGDMTKPICFQFGFVLLCVNGKTNLSVACTTSNTWLAFWRFFSASRCLNIWSGSKVIPHK